MAEKTVPQVLYNTPDPLAHPSELYVVLAVVLESATDPVKCWVVKEEHGFWDEANRKFENRATTLLPNDQKHCLSLDDALKAVNAQVIMRVKSGFKYQFEWYPYAPPFFRRFEIRPDGMRKQY